MQNLYNELKTILSNENDLMVDGKLLKNKIVELALNLDPKLIKILLTSASLKKHFFVQIDDVLVFDKIKFQHFVSNKQFLPDSYTAFKNKIGLVTENGSYITENKDVVLAWPYKDCVLEGGQTKEDQKRSEIFWNETLAPDEIDRLVAPKVLTGFKKYDQSGEHDLGADFDISKENLIIKGNNLLALHSLKKKFKGKVKLIYIDPPYNTGKDGFQYNDNFSVSSWLVFMKNRLEIAKELLSTDGVIFVQVDDKYKDYLKICCDEIFKIDNFIVNIVWRKRGGAPNDKVIGATHENILLYAKSENYKLYKKPRTEEQNERYLNPDNHPKGKWAADNLMANVKGGRGVDSLHFAIINPNTGESHFPSSNGNWRFNQTTINKLLSNNEIYFGKDGKGKPKLKRFFNDLKDEGVSVGTFWDDLPQNSSATSEILMLFGSVNEFDTPKPEKLLQRIIHLATKENDLVLDFFGGSGTTGAVAHKMQRQYILVEQMDYIHDLPEARLRKVIKCEQGGISESVNWQGGGSFVYCELKKYNQEYIDQITQADNTEKLLTIWQTMQESSFLSYKIDVKAINETISEFKDLPLDDQKKFLMEILDKNQLYVNYSEIDDEDFNISDADKNLNRIFYGEV